MFQRFFDEGLAQASFLVACPRAREAVVIDPRRDVDVYAEAARALGVRITSVFETHIHADFACGSRELLGIGARVFAGPGSGLRYPHHETQDGERLRIGDLSIQCIHTPGHTPEHISILASQPDAPVRVFSGDTLFAGAVGRPDLLGDAMTRRLAGDLYDSLFGKLLSLDDGVEVHPGHGAGSLCGAGISNAPHSTIGQERRFNRMLQFSTRDQFVEAVLADLPATPPYFPRMKLLNKEGPPLLGLVNGYRGPGPVSAGAAAQTAKTGAIIVDLRPASAFGERHPAGALNLAYGSKVGYWGGWVLPTEARIVLLATDERQAADAARQLLRIGLSRIEGWIQGGIEAWVEAGLPTSSIAQMSVTDLVAARRAAEAPALIDVRTDREWNDGHIDGAIHVPLDQLVERATELTGQRAVATMCEAGYRSALAASVLARAGVRNVINITGGMAAWRRLEATT